MENECCALRRIKEEKLSKASSITHVCARRHLRPFVSDTNPRPPRAAVCLRRACAGAAQASVAKQCLHHRHTNDKRFIFRLIFAAGGATVELARSAPVVLQPALALAVKVPARAFDTARAAVFAYPFHAARQSNLRSSGNALSPAVWRAPIFVAPPRTVPHSRTPRRRPTAQPRPLQCFPALMNLGVKCAPAVWSAGAIMRAV